MSQFVYALVASIGKFPEKGPEREAMDWMSDHAKGVVWEAVQFGSEVMAIGAEHYQSHRK